MIKTVFVLSVLGAFFLSAPPAMALHLPETTVDGFQVIRDIQLGTITRQNITAEQQRALLDVVVPAQESLVETANSPVTVNKAVGESCWTTWQRWSQKSSHGNTLYTWWQGLKWCARAGQITSSSVFDRGGESSTPGWSFKGHAGQGSWNLGWETRQYTQENFTFGIGWFSYTSTKCGQIRGGATGLYSGRASCGLNP